MNNLREDLSIFSLTGKTILVTGATKGIGLAIAEGLAHAGANVVGIGRTPTFSSLLFSYKQCNLLDSSNFETIANSCVNEYGGIHAYFHVAGITAPNDEGMQEIDSFTETINVNLTGAYRCCRYVGSLMKTNKSGSIVTVTSIGALLGFPDNPGYVASKGGLRMLSKALALDLGKFNIRVNSLVPGYIHTAMTDKSFNDSEKSVARTARTMLGRWGETRDLVGAAIFLASDASSYVTASDLVIDGGWTAKGL
jgi:NAD(P)-dependent dehydrogenase (short-subunit alcohol dehydrogenase family)